MLHYLYYKISFLITMVKKKIQAPQVNIRIPIEIQDKIDELIEETGKSKTDIYKEALTGYIEKITARRCQGCNFLNLKECKFCCNCGLPLNKEGLEEFQAIKEYIYKNPRVLMDNAKRLESDHK